MAREQYLRGVSEEQLRPPSPPEKPHTVKGKWQNFWYHYKWPVRIVGFLVIAGAFIVWQTATTVKPDYKIALLTAEAANPAATEQLRLELTKYAKDVNGDGEISVVVEALPLGQYAGGPTLTSAEINNEKLMLEVATGDTMGFIFDTGSYTDRLTLFEEEGEESFFDVLPLSGERYDAVRNIWNWRDSVYQQSEWGEALPVNLYFGVRRMGGSAEGEEAQLAHDTCAELFTAFVAGSTGTAGSTGSTGSAGTATSAG